jgi:hypothetical protein
LSTDGQPHVIVHAWLARPCAVFDGDFGGRPDENAQLRRCDVGHEDVDVSGAEETTLRGKPFGLFARILPVDLTLTWQSQIA